MTILREPIKFRIWIMREDKSFRQVDTNLVELAVTNGEITGIWLKDNDEEDASESYLVFGVDTWIVFDTGIKDQDGKDIYFEDIVEFSFTDKQTPGSDYHGTATITKTINRGVGIWYEYDNPDMNDDGEEVHAVLEGGLVEDLWEDSDLWTVKVIGNTYENPELLNKKEVV